MSNIYIAYHFTIEPKNFNENEKQLGSEILIAELGEKPFESFVETETGIVAYIQKELHTKDILDDIYILTSPEFTISYNIEAVSYTHLDVYKRQ